MENQAEDPSNQEAEGSSALDHALLESLFYNEMMMLNTSFPTSSSFWNQQFNEATQPRRQYSEPQPASAGVDPNTIAEKEMLHDFGVASSPAVQNTDRYQSDPGQYAMSESGTDYHRPASTTQPQHVSAVPMPVQDSKHVPIYPAESNHSLHPSAVPKPPAVPDSKPPLSINTSAASSAVPQGRTKQLVDQFATLASRLGIELPTNVLQSLTAGAASNDIQLGSSKPPSASANNVSAIASENAGQTQRSCASSVPTLADAEETGETGRNAVDHLRKTAEEAICSATKRRASDIDESDGGKDGFKHGKRRKKPRLADCESRLAELRAENQLLKRHLGNISNKAHRFDQEKEAAGRRIHGLLEANSGPDEMNRAVREFTEMYSDYGRNRQQELNFHLEQLQRLVNPTNFTKMGLWTLGQNSVSPKNNPIAGILQKELDITPQQGRKILDQSEKIQALCDNLKECLALLAKLKALCQQKTQIFQDRMDKCREILTTKQVVKLIKWINDHTQLLETVCPGWGTEHIHSTSKHS